MTGTNILFANTINVGDVYCDDNDVAAAADDDDDDAGDDDDDADGDDEWGDDYDASDCEDDVVIMMMMMMAIIVMMVMIGFRAKQDGRANTPECLGRVYFDCMETLHHASIIKRPSSHKAVEPPQGGCESTLPT